MKNYTIERQFGSGWVEVDLKDCLIAEGDWFDRDSNLQEIFEYLDNSEKYFVEIWDNSSCYFDSFCTPPDQIRFVPKERKHLESTWDGITCFGKESLEVILNQRDLDLLAWSDCYGPEEDGGFIDLENYETVHIDMYFGEEEDRLPMTYYGVTGTQAGDSFEWPGDCAKDADTLIRYLLDGDAGENDAFSLLAGQWLEMLQK